MMRLLLSLLLLLSFLQINAQTYPKVILPGDYPDPSIMRDGKDYYMTHSPFYYAPGFLIWHSQDLMNWSLIGSGVTKGNPIIPDAMNEMPEAFEWAKTDTFWAPDVIRLKDGKYYMYYCNCEGSSPLSCMGLAVSDSIEGPYSDKGI